MNAIIDSLKFDCYFLAFIKNAMTFDINHITDEFIHFLLKSLPYVATRSQHYSLSNVVMDKDEIQDTVPPLCPMPNHEKNLLNCVTTFNKTKNEMKFNKTNYLGLEI